MLRRFQVDNENEVCTVNVAIDKEIGKNHKKYELLVESINKFHNSHT